MIKNPIEVNDYARIFVEDSNYTLEYRVRTKAKLDGSKAKSEWKWICGGYFPTAGSALRSFVENAPVYSPEELNSFKDLVACIKNAEKRISELLGQ